MKGQKKNDVKTNMGITLVSLVVSIIVMLILAGISINAVVGDNGILTQAQEAALATTYTSYVEELQINTIDGELPTCSGQTMRTYISSIEDDDLNSFVIINGELYYIGTNAQEKEVAEKYGIKVSLASSESDVVEIVATVLNSSTKTGKALYDKSTLHSEDWGVITDYDENYEQTGQYGTGYYYLSSGTYTVDGETITVIGNYVINYETMTLISLSSRYVLWSIDSTIAVTNGLVLNINPSNLASIEYKEITVEDDAVAVAKGEESATAYQLYEDGTDTGITMYGDVVYDEDSNSLVFNESDDNVLLESIGEAGGGYMKLVKDDDSIDFSNGFTFEIYANLSRLLYDNGSTYSCSGLFCRIPTLQSNVTESLRFGFIGTTICKFHSNSSWLGTGEVLSTASGGGVNSSNCGYDVGEDFYLTFVYTAYDESTADETQQKYYKENQKEIDKIEYYVNGELYGYTYYGSDSYQKGLETWNESCPFYLGATPWWIAGSVYYLKGSVYTARLYTYSMTEEEVYQNRALTLTYRESFQ